MSRMTGFMRSGLAITLQLLCVLTSKPGRKGSKRVTFWSFPGTRFLRVLAPSMPNEVVFGPGFSEKCQKTG